jgi:coenzyme PQQ synthesis protein D (PqqD)
VGGADRTSGGTAFRLGPDVVLERVEDSSLLINLRTNRMFELDATGTRLWELLSDGRDLDGAEAAMVEEFDVQPDVLHGEVTSLLERLRSEGLVVRAGPA